MKIGILKADSVLPQFQPAFGDYPAMISALLLEARPDAEITTYDVEHFGYPETIDECDAYVITGSKKSVYDDEPWIHRLAQYVRELHAARHKTIGICFGHQMVAHALDGETLPAEAGWGVGAHQSEILATESWMDPPLSSFNLLVSHKDQVSKLPTGAELLGASEFCPNAMFRLGDHMLTFQGHPEFCKSYSKALMDFREDILGESVYRAGVDSLARDTHEKVIARWIINFIGYDVS